MTRFALPTAKLGFDGSLLLAQWTGAALSEVWAFPYVSAAFNIDDNVYRPQTGDANSNMHMESKGLTVGTLEISTPMILDRHFVTFWNAVTQNATRGFPLQMSLTAFGGAGVQNAGSIFIRQVRVAAQTAVDGRAPMVMLQITAFVCDPYNAQALATLAAPASLGTSGTGICSFMRSSLTDQAGTPNDYRMTQFILTHDNNMVISPTRVPGFALSEGGIPGQRTGSFSVQQDKNAANPLPAAGHPAFTLNLVSGDLSATATGTLNTSYDSQSTNLAPDQLIRGGKNFALYSPNTGTDLVTWA